MDRLLLSEEGHGRNCGRGNASRRRGLSGSDTSNRVHAQSSRNTAQNEAPELVRSSEVDTFAHRFDTTAASQQPGFQMLQMHSSHRGMSSVPVMQSYQFSPYPTASIGYLQPQEPLLFQYVPDNLTNRQVPYQPYFLLPHMQQDQAVYHPLRHNQYTHAHQQEPEPVVIPSPLTTPQQSHDPPLKPKQSGNALWVGNIPTSATIVDLKDHFSRGATSTIESVKLIARTRCAFVNYATHEACVAALERFHDSRFHGTAFVCRMRKQLRADQSETAVGPAESKQPGDMARDEEAAGRDKTRLTAEKRYFIMKSLSVSELEDAKRKHTWATQEHNVDRLNQAYGTAKTVYLLFSANKSGAYFGLARVASSITPMDAQVAGKTDHADAAPSRSASRSEPSSNFVTESDAAKFTPTPATEFAPKGRIYEDPARQIVFWEATDSSGGGRSNSTVTLTDEQQNPNGQYESPGKAVRSTSTAEEGADISKPPLQHEDANPQTPAQEPTNNPLAQARPSTISRSESLPNPATRPDLNAPVIVTSSSASLYLLRRASCQDTLSNTSKSDSISTSTSTKSRATNTTNLSSFSSSSRTSFERAKNTTASTTTTTTSEDQSGEVQHTQPTTNTNINTNTTTFQIEWLSTRKLPFSRLRGLRNAWNGNREVKVARDGTEVEPEVGEKVVNLFFEP